MADSLHLQLVTPERVLVDEQVSEVDVPALEGFIGVLPGHAPLLSQLKAGGVLTYRAAGGSKSVAVYGGFVEVMPDRVRVLADAAQPGSEINPADAKKTLDAAAGAANKPATGDPQPALDELQRAEAAAEAASKK